MTTPIPPESAEKCCEKCGIAGDFLGEVYCGKDDCTCHSAEKENVRYIEKIKKNGKVIGMESCGYGGGGGGAGGKW